MDRSSQPRLIETDGFPFEFISTLAERESWRKEVYRPIYHVHKWWANRLGSVFRGILLGCRLARGTELEQAFYQKSDGFGHVVFDPFMGSGTTIGEAHKLGFVAIGQDINPVACESVRIGLGSVNRRGLLEAFSHLSETVGERIRALYRSTDTHGQVCDVLYYFWVKVVPCPNCEAGVDLFPSRIVARNACPQHKTEIRVCCPQCGDVFAAVNASEIRCPSCGTQFDPSVGTANGTRAICSKCSHSFRIAQAVRASGSAPRHRLYARLLLTPSGKKVYLRTSPEDERHYEESASLLKAELERGAIRLPEAKLAHGFNTRQAMGYNYLAWRDFFNERQLLALGWLHRAISEQADAGVRDALYALFSGLLEFNNMFASYKGEGTGAVRHMFSHHILKPERAPIEANVWGTPKSSGSFSNLFGTRLLRAVDYREDPFEVKATGRGKDHRASRPMSGQVTMSVPSSCDFAAGRIYLACGSSDRTNLADRCVDLIVTDPPFFDNVHYSELADFFYAWQILYPHGFVKDGPTTRHEREVQDADPARFSEKLRNVFVECNRVLKDDGLLVFTYHHSRAEGWTSMAAAVYGAGFSIVNAHPVKAEMSVAMPKSQAKEPIQLDVILVCRKRERDDRPLRKPKDAANMAVESGLEKATRLAKIGLKLSRNDRRVIMMSQFLAALGSVSSPDAAVSALTEEQRVLENAADEAAEGIATVGHLTTSGPQQMRLPFA